MRNIASNEGEDIACGRRASTAPRPTWCNRVRPQCTEGYAVTSIIFSPSQLGIPSDRYRKYTFLNLVGTVALARARLEHVLNFLEAAGEPKASVSPKRAYQFLRSADKDTLTKFSNNAPEKIMHGTVGAMDVFYLPSGWVFTERVGRGADAFGIRVSVLMKE